MKKIFVISTLMFLVGCATVKHSRLYSDQNFSLSSINTTNSVIIGTDIVAKHGFKNSFKSEYKNNENLYAVVLDSIQANLSKSMGESQIEISKDPDAGEVLSSNGFSEEFRNKALSFFQRQSHEYIIFVKQITISDQYQPGAQTMMSDGTMATGASSTSAVVEIESEIWDVEQKKKVYAFKLSDESKVSLFMYGSALRSAVSKAARNTAKYIAKAGNLK